MDILNAASPLIIQVDKNDKWPEKAFLVETIKWTRHMDSRKKYLSCLSAPINCLDIVYARTLKLFYIFLTLKLNKTLNDYF